MKRKMIGKVILNSKIRNLRKRSTKPSTRWSTKQSKKIKKKAKRLRLPVKEEEIRRLGLAIVKAAKEGKADAVRMVESFQLDEKEHPGFDPSHITISQLTELTGKARQRIHEWHTKFGLPRNADKTFDMGIFLAWYEEFLLKKTSAGKKSVTILDPLKAVKAEKLKMELAIHRNELLDRSEVIIGQITWVQNIKSFCERSVDELSKLCSNQPREKIAEIVRGFFRDMYIEAAKVPKELRLPTAKKRELIEFLQKLKPERNKND